MKMFFCLLILSMTTNVANASFNFQSVMRKMATDILGEELVENFLGVDPKEMLIMPSLPKLLEDPKSLDFGNIDDQPKTRITEEERKNLDNHFLYELFKEIRKSDPSEDEYQQWMNILAQGATREGVFRALIYDKIYENLEFSSSKRVSSDAKEFTVLFYKKFIGIKISQTKMDHMNVFALKKIVCEKTLQMVDTLYQKNKDDAYKWYAIFSSDLAINYRKIWGNDIRKQRSPSKHYRWASLAGEQFIKSEIIIKLNKLYNHLDQN